MAEIRIWSIQSILEAIQKTHPQKYTIRFINDNYKVTTIILIKDYLSEVAIIFQPSHAYASCNLNVSSQIFEKFLLKSARNKVG